MVVLGGKLIVEAAVPTSADDYGLSRFNDADEHGVLNTRIRAQMPAHMRGGADSNFRPDASLPPYHAETITRIMFSGGITKPLNGEILPFTPAEATVGLRTYLEEESLLAERYSLYRQRIERVGPAATIPDKDSTKTIHTIAKSID